VSVENAEGARYGYTGDFWWPIETLKGLNELVLDATYGNPDYVRDYDEEAVVEQLIELVRNLIAEKKRVCIKAVTGRLQYVMQLLQPHLRLPFIASKKQSSVAAVYQQYGCLADTVLDRHTERAKAIIVAGEPYVAFHHLGERIPESDFDAFILVSAYMVPRENPIIQYGERMYRVALTDHADFRGTIDYVAAAAPKVVIVDNSRGGDAQTLAEEIRSRLNIPAVVGGD
jgi:putative mRNA 3-end processing factor